MPTRPGESLRYRGWVLVDLPQGRYATRGTRRVRVCRLREEHGFAVREFRRVVNEIEGGDAA